MKRAQGLQNPSVVQTPAPPLPPVLHTSKGVGGLCVWVRSTQLAWHSGHQYHPSPKKQMGMGFWLRGVCMCRSFSVCAVRVYKINPSPTVRMIYQLPLHMSLNPRVSRECDRHAIQRTDRLTGGGWAKHCKREMTTKRTRVKDSSPAWLVIETRVLESNQWPRFIWLMQHEHLQNVHHIALTYPYDITAGQLVCWK